MLMKFRSPFKLQRDHQDQRRSSNLGDHEHERRAKRSSLQAKVGLRIVTEISSQEHHHHQKLINNNVVVKSTMRLGQPNVKPSKNTFSCYLKTCHLCNKGLKLDKEVYMYRGDSGFCSIACRERQIFIDEMQELEASTKKMVASYRNSCNPRRHETCFLLEELSA